MEILKVVLTSLGSVVYLFVLTKIMGKRQISELTLFDYIIGITIGSIAAELSTIELNEVYIPAIAMLVYALIAVLISFLDDKSVAFRSIFTGKPIVLFNNGKFIYKNMKKGRIDIDEFMCQARVQGFFDLSDVKTAVLENNGKISFLTYAAAAPVTCSDMQLAGSAKELEIGVVKDGKIMYDNLKHAGINEKTVMNALSKDNLKLEDIMLASCNHDKKITFYEKQAE